MPTNDPSKSSERPEAKSSLAPRRVADSVSEMVEIVLPNDANPMGSLLGGRLMHWIDLAAALAAFRHTRNYVVTASTDHLDFRFPVRVGDLVVLKSSVNRAFGSSMEVGVKVWVEGVFTGERHHVSSAYLTFVSVDRQGHKQQVPPVLPESAEERIRYDDAGRRRELRQAEAKRKASLADQRE